jgi:hypothetical protein
MLTYAGGVTVALCMAIPLKEPHPGTARNTGKLTCCFTAALLLYCCITDTEAAQVLRETPESSPHGHENSKVPV